MHRRPCLLALLALALALAGCGEPDRSVLDLAKERGALRVAMEPTFRPFASKDKNGELVGFDVDLARALAKELGVEAEFVTVDWNSIIPTLTSKKADLIMSGMTITEERKRTIDYSEPYFHTSTILLLSKEKAPDVESLEDLDVAGRTIVAKEGTTGHFAAEKKFPQAKVVPVSMETDAVREVVLGRADAFLFDSWQIRRHGREHPEKTYVLRQAVTKEPYGIALRKGDPDTRNWLNETLAAMRADGRLQELYDKYELESAE